MNPFLSIRAGLFAATDAGSEASPSIAELLCATVCEYLLAHPDTIFDQPTWVNTIGHIPNQTLGTSENLTSSIRLPQIGQLVLKSISDQNPCYKDLQSALSGLPEGISELYCLSVAEVSEKTLSINFTSVVATPQNGDVYQAVTTSFRSGLSYSDPSVESNLRGIFGKYQPPASAPYFIITPSAF